jgi:hypothetical protein
VRAFSLGCLVAQRDAGRGVGAPGSRILLRPWGLVADVSFAAMFPGMAACRIPDCQVTKAGVRPRPGIQIEDIGGIQIVLAGVPPLALGTAIGDWFRRQDDAPRPACGCGRRCRGLPIQDAPVRGIRPELGHDLTVAGSAIADLQVSGSLELRLMPAILPGGVFAVCR